MELLAQAKVNFSLTIRGRRADGFHEIETLIVPISLADRLTIERDERPAGIAFECDDPSLPTGEDNLVVRAAARFFERLGQPAGVRITLYKKIPHGAGLGGGSSDAATVLRGLNKFFNAPFRPNELLEIAARLGSDVPFFLAQSPARCRGRGEVVEECKLDRSFDLLLVKPQFGVATPDAYARWSKSRELPGVDYRAQEFGDMLFENNLERAVLEKFPFLARLKTWLREQPEVGAALLSGSGSTIFAVLRDHADGAQLRMRIKESLDPTLWTCLAETLG